MVSLSSVSPANSLLFKTSYGPSFLDIATDRSFEAVHFVVAFCVLRMIRVLEVIEILAKKALIQ